ncbi:adrenocorticotropic hormone receptor [Lingula anatina]|uniref:Adrenocorticotropic hormone receptor n=1 Tax=Lingula anatina TaxID=7574 RepID=A0A1S3I3Z9_LINAN|nr:adrenocorticotropic hormone receptor [Lingula anatina]|eukprot:XP_013392992.1 adrenocorticotropic hormone receptor [Lingula anatina]
MNNSTTPGIDVNTTDQDSASVFAKFMTAGVVIGFVGFVENLISLIALLNMRRPFEAFHLLLINLAVSDLVVVGLAAVGSLIMLVNFNLDQCDSMVFVARVIMEMSYIALLTPVLATSALVVNQYLAITKPLRYQTIATQRRIAGSIIALWVATALIGVILHIAGYPKLFEDPGCNIYGENSNYLVIRSATFTVLLILITALVVIVYIQMFYAIKQRVLTSAVHQQERSHHADHKLNITIAILFGTVLLFWIPGIADSILVIFMMAGTHFTMEFVIFHQVTNLLFLANALIDPFIYGIRLQEVRAGYQKLFRHLSKLPCSEEDAFFKEKNRKVSYTQCHTTTTEDVKTSNI